MSSARIGSNTPDDSFEYDARFIARFGSAAISATSRLPSAPRARSSTWMRGGEVAARGVVGAVDRREQLDDVTPQPAAPGAPTVAARRATTALVEQHRLGDGPAVVHLADHVVVGELDVAEELLAELGVAVDLTDAFDGHARRVGRHAGTT